MKPLPLHIAARRWFDRANGNTYHSVVIYQNGAIVAEAPFSYGYGDHYMQTAAELIEHLGIVPPPTQYANGGSEPLHLWTERVGLIYSVDCIDVQRKKDL